MKNLLLVLAVMLTVVACTKEPVETCGDIRDAIDAKYQPLFQEALGVDGVLSSLDVEETAAFNLLVVARAEELAALGCN